MSDRQPPVSVFWPQPLLAAILNTSDGHRWPGGLPQDEIFSPCSLQKKTVAPIQPCEAFGNIVVAVNSRTSRIISNIHNAHVLLLSILI